MGVKHLGDITKINGHEIPLVDIVTGGSPCQDLSVAGKRAGLAGERSGLFMEQIRIIKEMRDECARQTQLRGTDEPIRPRYMAWENVPGAFSSNKGADFQAVLEETAKVAERDASIPGPPGGKWPSAGAIMGNGWSIAWRVHDAQFWGVPQRRKRIALVADFGGETAPEILFERKGLSGDSEESGIQGQKVAASVGTSAQEAGSYTLKMRGGREIDSKGHKAGKGPLVQTELSGTLGVSQDQTLIQNVYGLCSYDSNAMKSSNPHSGIYEADTARTLDNNGGNPACNQGGMMVVQGFDGYNQQSTGDVAMPLRSKSADSDHVPIVCLEGNGSRPSHKGDGYTESDVMYTLNGTEQHAVAYDGSNITCPTNASNPQDGDPCHTLHEDSRNYVVIENHPADSRVQIKDDGIVQILSSRMGTGGGNVPMVMEGINGQIAGTLDASYYKGCGERQGVEREVVCVGNGQLAQARISDKVGALNCMHDQQAVMVYGLDRASFNQGANAQYDFRVEEEKIGTQVAKGPGAVLSSIVRRLTPMECERLQGYPDGWTDIGEWVDSKGKLHKDADSPRYKALGNSIALPFWQWMAGRMVSYLGECPTMASLFDGISGFCLVFARVGCKPIWCSEIEEYPIAVAKRHFGDDEKGIKGDYEQYL